MTSLNDSSVEHPSVSIIINTDGRAKSLAVTLESLRHLHYTNFEVIVVYGPTDDGTRELLETWRDHVKVGHIPRRNLSESRNISLAMAAGSIVAFLDDDSIPEPEWLDKVTLPFRDPQVAAAGGYLFDHTGVTYQWKWGTADRMGAADQSWQGPAPEFNYPFSANIPHVMANSAFRLSALMEIGGFDERYVYFLDETDAICRLVDAGWKIIQLEGAPVHHKFLASHLRNEARVVTSWYQIIRSKIYFAIINAQGHHGVNEAIDATRWFADDLRQGMEWHIRNGRLDASYRERFADEFERGLRDGLRDGLQGHRTLYDGSALEQWKQPFKRFPTLVPEGERRCICLLTRFYPPSTIGGIGRYVQQLAKGLADLGHQVRVLTEDERDIVDFEEGVWVHRRRRQSHCLPKKLADSGIPQGVWDYSATALEVAKGIRAERPVDIVYAPLWDCEGIAFLLDGNWPLAVNLVTTLESYLKSNPHLRGNACFMRDFVTPMKALEQLMIQDASVLTAASQAIVDEISHDYSLVISEHKIHRMPYGLEDWLELPAKPVPSAAEGALRLLYVGRLEARKGIDVLLAALEAILPERPSLHVDLVGNNMIADADGETFQQKWQNRNGDQPWAGRVHFCGEVDDEQLRGYYLAADLFVAPSRFESFGLIFVEAMIYGLPVIGCRAGGMTEVIEEGVVGLLAEPGDERSLTEALLALLDNEKLRLSMGAAGRRRFLQRYQVKSMTTNFLALVDRTSQLACRGLSA